MKFLKIGGVILGALVMTTLGINAADVFSGNSGSMLGQLIATEDGACPSGMTEVAIGKTFSCIDIYEASPGDECPHQIIKQGGTTQDNINTQECLPVSEIEQIPWTDVTRDQAQLLCVRAGKRLPTATEWYTLALGTPDHDDSCNITDRSASLTGVYTSCRSAVGALDAVGNVWEWTDDDVIEGMYDGRTLPEEGYVTQVASDGVATVTESTPSEQFASDYIWSDNAGAYGILRGGFYGSGDDAGVYSIQAKIPPTAATVAIGFRCVL